MTHYHTSLCRVIYTQIASGFPPNLVVTDSVKAQEPLHLFIGVEINSSIYLTSGVFSINWDVFADGARYGRNWTGWTATDLKPRITRGWYAMYWSRAIDLTGSAVNPVLLYRPSIQFTMWGAGGTGITPIPDEFAVAEEPHYFAIDI